MHYITIAMTSLCFMAAGAGAMSFKTGNTGEMQVNGAIKATFGATQYFDFVDDNTEGDDADFDATRELGVTFHWILDENLKGVVSFEIGEGSNGGYFGSTDALVGGEEDGDISLELNELYIDFTTDAGIKFKIGSQAFNMGEIVYGSHLFYEVPTGATVSATLTDTSTIQAGWFRMADLMDDTETNTDDQADFLFVKLPVTMNALSFTPWTAYANIQKDVIDNAPYYKYSYFNYPGLLTGANGSVTDPTATDDVSAWYLGLSFGYTMNALSVKASATYGDMDWETATLNATIAGYFTDLVIDYKMDGFTPEFFAFYGNGPDANDKDFNMMPVLIGGPTYTTSYCGGSRFNDNMFDSYNANYVTSMWAVGFKLKDIKIGDNKLSHEFQIMYAEGTAEDSIFESPNDILMNEDESVVEINFNSEYQIMAHLLFATELGYMTFDQDSDYNEAVKGSVEDFWKVACSIELTF